MNNSKHTISGEYRELSIDVLTIDDRYQRQQSSAHIKRMANDWKDKYFQPPSVAKRDDGTYAVVNGGHRIQALRNKGYSGRVPCWVLPVNNIEDEAESFVGTNTRTNNLSYNQRFIAKCVAGDQKAIALKKVIEMHGLGLKKGEQSKANTIKSTSKIYRYFTPEVLDEVLEFVNKHWGENQQRLGGYWLDAIRKFRKELQSQLGLDLMSDKVDERFATIQWSTIDSKKNDLRFSDRLSRQYAAKIAFMDLYNFRRHEDWRLTITLS